MATAATAIDASTSNPPSLTEPTSLSASGSTSEAQPTPHVDDSMTASPAERFELITRRLQETLGGEAIRAILEQGKHPKCYWGASRLLSSWSIMTNERCPFVYSENLFSILDWSDGTALCWRSGTGCLATSGFGGLGTAPTGRRELAITRANE